MGLLLFLQLVSLYPALIGLVAIPLALGSAKWPVRLAGLFVAAIVLGLFPVLSSMGFQYFVPSLFGVLLLIGGTGRTFPTLQIGFIFFGIATIGSVLWMSPWDTADPNGFVRGLIAVGSISLVALLLRVIGYRLIRIAGIHDSKSWHAGTGYGLDQWTERLNTLGGKTKQRAELFAELQRFGIDHYWSDVIMNSYLKCVGRYPIGIGPSGKQLYVVPKTSSGFISNLSGRLKGVQFSLAQMMVWSLAVAGALAFVRAIARDFPTTNDIAFGPPILLLLSLISLNAAIVGLSLPPRIHSALFGMSLASIAGLVAMSVMPTQGLPLAPIGLATVLAVVTWVYLFAGFTLMRLYGYRLVQVTTYD